MHFSKVCYNTIFQDAYYDVSLISLTRHMLRGMILGLTPEAITLTPELVTNDESVRKLNEVTYNTVILHYTPNFAPGKINRLKLN